MPVRLTCTSCQCMMHLADDLRGKLVKCKTCGTVLTVPGASELPTAELVSVRPLGSPTARPSAAPPSKAAPIEGYAIAAEPLRPTALPARSTSESPQSRRRQDDDDMLRRRRRKTSSGSNPMLVWGLAAGGVTALILVIVLIVVLRSSSGGGGPVVEAGMLVQNEAVAAKQEPAVPEKRNAPPLIADPAAGETLKGEQIYQKLLQSTVWIVATHKVNAVANKNQPFGQLVPQPGPQPGFPQPGGPQPGFPQPPNFGQPKMPNFGQPKIPKLTPNFPKPNFPKIPQPGVPNLPGMQNPGLGDFMPPANQKSNLRGTSWSGSETLQGYGKLTFQFISDVGVLMFDNDGTSRGSFIHNADAVRLTFGGVVYNGNVNGDRMSGNATNGQTNWTWTLTRAAGNAPLDPQVGGVKATGSGSLVDLKHRLIVTNVHVVGKCDTVEVYFADYDAQGDVIAPRDTYAKKRGVTGRVVLREERADLAFVQLDRLPEGVQSLTVAKSKAKPAQQVHSMGNPGASKSLWVYSPGKVRGTPIRDQWKIFDDLENRTCNYDAVKLETDSAINPGDSGGPLVDDRCSLVGVAHGGSLVANNISSFIDASEVRQLLERYYRGKGEQPPQ